MRPFCLPVALLLATSVAHALGIGIWGANKYSPEDLDLYVVEGGPALVPLLQAPTWCKPQGGTPSKLRTPLFTQICRDAVSSVVDGVEASLGVSSAQWAAFAATRGNLDLSGAATMKTALPTCSVQAASSSHVSASGTSCVRGQAIHVTKPKSDLRAAKFDYVVCTAWTFPSLEPAVADFHAYAAAAASLSAMQAPLDGGMGMPHCLHAATGIPSRTPDVTQVTPIRDHVDGTLPSFAATTCFPHAACAGQAFRGLFAAAHLPYLGDHAAVKQSSPSVCLLAPKSPGLSPAGLGWSPPSASGLDHAGPRGQTVVVASPVPYVQPFSGSPLFTPAVDAAVGLEAAQLGVHRHSPYQSPKGAPAVTPTTVLSRPSFNRPVAGPVAPPSVGPPVHRICTGRPDAVAPEDAASFLAAVEGCSSTGDARNDASHLLALLAAVALLVLVHSNHPASKSRLCLPVACLLVLSHGLPLAVGACVHVTTPPLALPVGVCSPPWDHSAGTPLPGLHSTTVNVNVSVTGLVVTPGTTPTVNRINSTLTAVGPAYSLPFTTPPGDTLWPWKGLAVSLSLSNSSGVVVDLAAHILPGVTFETTAATLGLGDAGNVIGVAVADVEGDGDLDLYLSKASNPTHRMFLNDGTGIFTDGSTATSTSSSAFGMMPVFFDMDGDGDVDLLLSNQNEDLPYQLFVNDGTARFTEEAAERGLDAVGHSRAHCVFDMDADGDVDIVAGTGSGVLVWVNSGDGTFVSDPDPAAEGNRRGFLSTLDNRGLCCADYNGDGHVDVFIVRPLVGHSLYDNNGAGFFTDVSASRGMGSTSGAGQGCVWFDADGDADLDVFVAVTQAHAPGYSLDNLLFVNPGGPGPMVNEALPRGVARSEPSLGVAAWDYDLDGDVDLMVWQGDGYPDALLANDGQGHFAEVAGEFGVAGDASYSVTGVPFDIDGDGDLDLYTGVANQPNRLYLNHHARVDQPVTLFVRALSRTGAATAFGATVTVQATSSDWVGLRVVDGGSGLHTQMAYDVHDKMKVCRGV